MNRYEPRYGISSYQLVSELALPFEVPTLGVVVYGVVDLEWLSMEWWLGPKEGANHDQYNCDQRGRWFFKGGVLLRFHIGQEDRDCQLTDVMDMLGSEEETTPHISLVIL
ncbi:hypothetical protein Tco_1440942, partial [Tanacetum coccineum]